MFDACVFFLLFLASPAAAPKTQDDVQTGGAVVSRTASVLVKLEKLWEVAAASEARRRRFSESQAVLQQERLEWMAERDRLTVTLGGLFRQLNARKTRLRELIQAFYKLSHGGRAVSPWRRPGVVRDGRFLLLVLLEREVSEQRRLQSEIGLIQARRDNVDRDIADLQKLEENFRLLAMDAESLVAQSLFEIRELEKKLEGVDKNTFDAQDWQRYGHIQSLRASMKDTGASLARYKGMMLKPVEGPILPPPPGSPPRRGVFWAAAPNAPVRATHDGTVRFVGPMEGYGTVIVIEHEFDIHSIIGRVAEPSVQPGSRVRRGQVIARTPPGSASTARPVYLELRMGREVLDWDLWINKKM